jgi:microcin C transport system substrate-binding protein
VPACVIDSSQYQQRQNTFDFDIISPAFRTGIARQRAARLLGLHAAGKDGSRNVIGIQDPAVDKLIDRIIQAKDRHELLAATHALDRVLLWNDYVVPQWYTPFERLAFWDMYRRPDKLPSRSSSFLRVWWWDSEAAKRLSDARG